MPTHKPTLDQIILNGLFTAPLLPKLPVLRENHITGKCLQDCITELCNAIGPDNISEEVRQVKAKNDHAFQAHCKTIESLKPDDIEMNTIDAAASILPTLAKLYDTAYQLHLAAKQTIADNNDRPRAERRGPRFYEAMQVLNPGSCAAFYEDQLDIFSRTLTPAVKWVLEHFYDCAIITKPPEPTLTV